jgi:hypothetical protein
MLEFMVNMTKARSSPAAGDHVEYKDMYINHFFGFRPFFGTSGNRFSSLDSPQQTSTSFVPSCQLRCRMWSPQLGPSERSILLQSCYFKHLSEVGRIAAVAEMES